MTHTSFKQIMIQMKTKWDLYTVTEDKKDILCSFIIKAALLWGPNSVH